MGRTSLDLPEQSVLCISIRSTNLTILTDMQRIIRLILVHIVTQTLEDLLVVS